MKKTLLSILLFIFATPLMASDEIVVKLATESRLLPIYLTHFGSEGSSLSKEYLQELERVMRFDLSYNGMTSVVPSSDSLERRAHEGSLSAQTDNIYYVISVQATSSALQAHIDSLSAGTRRKTTPLRISGDLSVDRKVIHQLADVIHQTLFNKPGVASTRVLYTIREKNRDSQGEEYLSEVWESDWDGQNRRQITFDGSYCITPAYLPAKPGYGSGNFFYVSYKTGQPKIFVAALQASERPQRFTSLRGNQLMPAISQDRKQVAFVNDVTGNPDLFMQRFDPEVGTMGKPYQIFSTRRGTQASPTFSPDGRQLAFVSNKDGSPRIYVMSVPKPGTKQKDLRPRLITHANRENTAPVWSPDGSKLAYSAKTNGTRQIWVYDFRTGKESQLTSGSGHKENPTWAPNSLHLLFNSADYKSSELYLVNLNQPEAVKITNGPGEKRFPDWEPRFLR